MTSRPEVLLAPGEFHFGSEDTVIRTLLGSCVSITLWHPGRRIGGMCHFLLPRRGKGSLAGNDGRYADEALELFLAEVAAAGTVPADYEAKIFGGGDQFRQSRMAASTRIPARNVQTARELLRENGFRITAEHVGGSGPRSIVFDLSTGTVWLRYDGQAAAARSTARPDDHDPAELTP